MTSPYPLQRGRKATWDDVVGRGPRARRKVDEQPPLAHPPAGDTSDGVVGRGPRARRFSGNERNQANGTTRAVPERAAFLFGLFGEQSLQRDSPYIGEQSLQRNSPYIASM